MTSQPRDQQSDFLVNRVSESAKAGEEGETGFMKKPRKIEKVKIRLIDNLIIEGTLHYKEQFRLSDAMNDSQVSFLPLTDVVVFDHYGRMLEKIAFISINRSQIKYICSHQDIHPEEME